MLFILIRAFTVADIADTVAVTVYTFFITSAIIYSTCTAAATAVASTMAAITLCIAVYDAGGTLTRVEFHVFRN